MSPGLEAALLGRRSRRSRRSPSSTSPPGATPTWLACLGRRRATAPPRRAPAPRRRARARAGSSVIASGTDGDRGLVDLEVALGQAGHRELVDPRARPPSTSRSRSASASSSRRSAGAQRLGVAGRRRAARPRRARATFGSPRCPTRAPRCPRPSPRAARRRTTRRPSDGAQNTVAPASRVALLGVGDRAEPLDVRRAPVAQQLVGLGPVAADPEHRVAVERAPTRRAAPESLARLVPADEEHRRAVASASARPSRTARPRRRSTTRRTRPPSASLGHVGARLRHRDADRELARRTHRDLQQRACPHVSRPRPRRGTCRPSGR